MPKWEETPGKNLQSWAVYLALNHREPNPHGDFHWAIVLTMSSPQTIIYVNANNPYPPDPTQPTWLFEKIAPGNWTPNTSRTLLSLYEITVPGPSRWPTAMSVIEEVGRDIITRQSVSADRGDATFNCRTWALDVLASLPHVGPEKTKTFECRAEQATHRWRDELRRDHGDDILSQPGKYKVFRNKE
ncbi:hypothetical protein F4779DRAFT_609423 [Xylariaceae sp. FL0662B]|nr:hypothetical protein F4779DRAFT_609423 [Xylariaceae sp. FL0662B]